MVKNRSLINSSIQHNGNHGWLSGSLLLAKDVADVVCPQYRKVMRTAHVPQNHLNRWLLFSL
ncbi:MAG TPA: hypothetical protein PLG17_11530 [Thermodesulfobacteriota bacterium]|nr:hypothetical protein [Thermodesulfobacteriota bacterium]